MGGAERRARCALALSGRMAGLCVGDSGASELPAMVRFLAVE